MSTPIYDHLKKLGSEKRVPFHMPGHMRKGTGAFPETEAFDITEIAGYDNLHQPEGIIRASMDMLKKVYHTRESWYLVNGSTVGILAAVAAVCHPGDTISIARNCHKSVYHVIRLLHLHVRYLFPKTDVSFGVMGEINPEDVERQLAADPSIRCVVITSPTYEGIVSDIRTISRITHQRKIPLIVDEAHGAHLVFHPAFPQSAVSCGADLVIQSTHKTLPALTQTALLHLCSDLVAPERIFEMLDLFETSSPSYLLMASAEYSVDYMRKNVNKVDEYVDNLRHFRKKCDFFQNIRLLSAQNCFCFDYDIGKLVFSGGSHNGESLAKRLFRNYGIEVEADCDTWLIAMSSVCTSAEDFEKLEKALFEIDEDVCDPVDNTKLFSNCETGTQALEIWEAMDKKENARWVSLSDSAGKIAADFVMLYPPGIPILVPGEKITRPVADMLQYKVRKGCRLMGLNREGLYVL